MASFHNEINRLERREDLDRFRLLGLTEIINDAHLAAEVAEGMERELPLTPEQLQILKTTKQAQNEPPDVKKGVGSNPMHDELPENEFVRKGVWLSVRLPQLDMQSLKR